MRPLRRTYAQLGMLSVDLTTVSVLNISADVTKAPVPILQPPTGIEPSPFDLLMALDSWLRPGLTEAQFGKLFAKCACGLIMTRRAFGSHECLEKSASANCEGIVIDLTDTDVDED
jgi:hypothetical protein